MKLRQFLYCWALLVALIDSAYSYEIPVLDSTTTVNYQRLRSKEGTISSQIIKAEIPFTSLVAHWQGQQPEGSAYIIEVRTSTDGQRWTEWTYLQVEETPEENPRGEFFSQLVGVEGEERTYQYVEFRVALAPNNRGQFPALENLSFTFYDGGVTPPEVLENLPHAGRQTRSIGKPDVVSRSGWGSNESISTWAPEYRNVTHIIIHHTVSSNSPPEGDWFAQVRIIQEYHAATKGWGDIAYHYLIDPNGVIYEGRKGGDDVIGAHAYGFNYGTMGISFLGNFNEVSPTQAALNSAKKLIAWKVAQKGIEPLGTEIISGKTLNTIAGHRDTRGGKPDDCPGNNIYSQLPTIRSDVAKLIANVQVKTINKPTGDLQLVSTSLAQNAKTVTIDGKTVSFTPTAEGINFNTGVLQANLVTPLNIVVKDSNGKELVNTYYPFGDVPPGQPYTNAILQLWKANIVEGQNGMFEGDRNVKRSEFLKMALLATKRGTEFPQTTTSFQDVPKDYWASGYINYAQANAIASGKDGKFRPEASITRAETAKIIVNAVPLPTFLGTSTLSSVLNPTGPGTVLGCRFNDVTPPFESYSFYVKQVCQSKIMKGYDDGTFKPGQTLSRIEAAFVACRALNLNNTGLCQ